MIRTTFTAYFEVCLELHMVRIRFPKVRPQTAFPAVPRLCGLTLIVTKARRLMSLRAARQKYENNVEILEKDTQRGQISFVARNVLY